MASETLTKIDRAYDVVSALCEGKREWLMSIPARPDHDPDLIIGDALLTARNEISRLTRELEEARRERSAAKAEVLTAQASLRRVERVLEEARALLRELTEHEPVLDDERLRYVEIQVDREAWEAARSAVCAHPTERSESDE